MPQDGLRLQARTGPLIIRRGDGTTSLLAPLWLRDGDELVHIGALT